MAEMLPPGCPIRKSADQSRLRLPAAFRSLLRPSSPDGAKASVVCPYTLDRKKRISPGPGVYVAILSTQKLCSFQGTSASAAPPCGARGTRGQNLQEPTSETPARGAVVGVTGIGPVTSSLSGTRSNQLSYTPRSNNQCTMQNAECRMWFDNIVHCALRIMHCIRRQGGGWWRQSDSNRRHPACKAGALPTELCPQWEF